MDDGDGIILNFLGACKMRYELLSNRLLVVGVAHFAPCRPTVLVGVCIGVITRAVKAIGVFLKVFHEVMVGVDFTKVDIFPFFILNLEEVVDNILAYGSDWQKEAIIEECKAGRKPYTLGFTEPQAGSDNSAMATRATHKDGKVYINGMKTFNTGATVSKYMMCIAREYENDNPYKDMSWYLVPLNAPGVKITPIPKIGCHCVPTCEVRLDNVELDENALVGVKGRGFYQLMKNFETERLMSCAVNVGLAKCAYNVAAAYAGQRVQFGEIIGNKQIIQQKIVDMRINCMAMENMVLNCAWRKDHGEQMGVDISLLKRFTGKAAFEVIDDAMQIMGGIGYTQDCIIDRLWRDQRGFRIFAGSEEIMVHASARTLIKEASKK